MHAPGRGCGTCCGGCSNLEAQVNHLNATWCPRVNKALLHPAGYACVAHYWYVECGGGCHCDQHVAIVVVKGPVLDQTDETYDETRDAEAGGGAAGPVVTVGLPAAAVVPVVTGPQPAAAAQASSRSVVLL